MNDRDRIVHLWGVGGYYRIIQHADGSRSIPQGQQAWERFATFAPQPLLAAAVHSLQTPSRSAFS